MAKKKPCEQCRELQDDLTGLRHERDIFDGYYRRSNAAYESLCQDIVNFLGNETNKSNIPPHSISGGQLLAALGKANALYQGGR